MSATEITAKQNGTHNGKDVYASTGQKGRTFMDTSMWVVEKQDAGINVRNVTSSVHVQGVQDWAAFQEDAGSNTIVTIFEII